MIDNEFKNRDTKEQLTRLITGRPESFLAADMRAHDDQLSAGIEGASILVIGAAGSIGRSFVSEVLRFLPGRMHLVDLSENNLAELVRDLRSQHLLNRVDFRTFTLDYSAVEMKALLRTERYDYILNFSALKHVRSERDAYTLMRMLQVNVIGNLTLLRWIREFQCPQRVFSVSSDKAVRPGNLMGASKALMERLYLAESNNVPFNSARFANVAFSDGSLLHSFRNRLDKGQPICAPSDVRRYFISHTEAGQLCILGCFLLTTGEIIIPRFSSTADMLAFSDIACEFLRSNGLEPYECSSEEEARERAAANQNTRTWPCYFSESDTSGEKPFEEFVDSGEVCDRTRFRNAAVVTQPLRTNPETIHTLEIELERLRTHESWSRQEVISIVQNALPQLAHIEGGRDLDEKM